MTSPYLLSAAKRASRIPDGKIYDPLPGYFDYPANDAGPSKPRYADQHIIMPWPDVVKTFGLLLAIIGLSAWPFLIALAYGVKL